jgi:hypothetical protein
MGLFDFPVKSIFPLVAQVAPFLGPVGAPISFAAGTIANADARQTQNKKIIDQQQRNQQMSFDPRFSDFGGGTAPFNPPQRQATNNAGFGSGFGNFLSDLGNNILSPISGLFGQIRPMITQQSQGQPALPTQSLSGGQESQTSGTSQAFIGGAGNLIGQAAKFLRSPGGSVGTGVAGGVIANMFGGGGSSMRITRKMKSQYRAVLNLNNGNYDAASNMLGVSQDMFIAVLLKRFRNDGPVVTKAALRKTKTTVRRLKSMCDMYDSLRPTATRRKAPMRRASSTTLIKN